MRRVAARLAATIVMLTAATVASAQTVDEIVQKAIAALGGNAALAKVKSRLTTGTITLSTPAGDIEGTIEILNAAPNKLRTLIKADLTSLGAGQLVLDQRFNGTAGYAMDSIQGNREITGNQLDNMRNSRFPNFLAVYKDMGVSAKLEGKQPVNDREAFLLVFEPTTGSAVHQYFDAQTYLPIRTTVKVIVPQLGNREIEQTQDLADYRDVDGVKIPFEIKTSSSVQNFRVVVKKVEHNVPIDEALFSKPATP